MSDKKRLLAIARAVVLELKSRVAGTRIRVRLPSRATQTNTDGWAVALGDLGKNSPKLEIWIDRFANHEERKLWVCFHAENRQQLTNITRRVSKKLMPIRIIDAQQTIEKRHLKMAKRLVRSESAVPILEKYSGGTTYYGQYNLTKHTVNQANRFVQQAAAFIESVARSLPRAKSEEENQDVYPRHENRIHVSLHLRRERSRILATTRKILDEYKCQVCGFCFFDFYGKLGAEFAEAHHMVPLSRLKPNVKTKIEDLVTVCANCHRMLHRMAGERDDVKKLRSLVRKR